jgi:Family of unknown function (DUF6364)
MQAKLTLQLDHHLISQAKSYAKHHGKSLSQLVAEYFRSLSMLGTTFTEPQPLSGRVYRYDRSVESATSLKDWEAESSISREEERKIIEGILVRRGQRTPVSTGYLQQLREEGRP